MKKIIFCFLGGFFVVFLGLKGIISPSPVAAVGKFYVTISPPINELVLEPGSKSTYGLTLYNNSDKLVIVDLRASPFRPQGEEGEVNISDNPLPVTKDWVTVYPQRVMLGPRESKVVSYTINLPSTAEPGGFYFAIVASSEGERYQSNPQPAVESGTSVVASVAELVLVKVNGPVNYDAQITYFDTFNKKRFFNYGPVGLVIKVKNLSNVHALFSNKVEVKNILFPMEDYTLSLKAKRILPQAVRLFKTEMPNKWHFGYYKAIVTTTYAGGNDLRRVILFWVVPLREILAAASIVVVIIILIYLLIRQSKHRQEELEEMKETLEKLEEAEGKLKK